jgi:DNA-directed RNA polymerase specialized sigma24 family protein
MVTLAADLPAAVVADLLGIHEATATRWAHRARRDWYTYLAQRRTEAIDLASGPMGKT